MSKRRRTAPPSRTPQVGDLVEVRVDGDWYRVVVRDPRAVITGYSPADLPAGARWWRPVRPVTEVKK